MMWPLSPIKYRYGQLECRGYRAVIHPMTENVHGDLDCIYVVVAGWLKSALYLYVDETWTHHRGCGWPRVEKVQQADASRWLWRLPGQERQCKHLPQLSPLPTLNPQPALCRHLTGLKLVDTSPQQQGRSCFNALYLTLGGVETWFSFHFYAFCLGIDRQL